MKSVCVTGVSSFTGAWIARRFFQSGWKTFGLCPRPEHTYQDIKRKRLGLLQGVDVFYDLPSQGDALLDWIRNFKPQVWIHHHHHMENYRQLDYDLVAFENSCLAPLSSIVEALSESECQGIIYSGSFFEPKEGGLDRPEPTPYGKSKRVVWDKLKSLCAEKSMLLSKVVIPDPIGPLENRDRMIPSLIEKSRSQINLDLRQPLAKADHLPVFALAETYVDVATKLLEKKSLTVKPSGWTGTHEDWIQEINNELIVKRLGLKPSPITKAKVSTSSHQSYTNPQSEKLNVDWEFFWNTYRDFEL